MLEDVVFSLGLSRFFEVVEKEEDEKEDDEHACCCCCCCCLCSTTLSFEAVSLMVAELVLVTTADDRVDEEGEEEDDDSVDSTAATTSATPSATTLVPFIGSLHPSQSVLLSLPRPLSLPVEEGTLLLSAMECLSLAGAGARWANSKRTATGRGDLRII